MPDNNFIRRHHTYIGDLITMSDPINCQIERIDSMIKQAELYAHWWMARATSGDIKQDSIYDGFDGEELTDERKISEAMKTAKTHIQKIEELTERKIMLMKQLNSQ